MRLRAVLIWGGAWAVVITVVVLLSVSVARGALPSCHYQAGGALPDLHCTPGITLKWSLTKYGVWDRVPCPANPPAAPAAPAWPLLSAAAKRYGVNPKSVVLDHLVPVWVGGSATSPFNVWPLPRRFLAAKRSAESRMRALCVAGKVPMYETRGLLSTDWRAAARFAAWAEKQ